MQEISESIQSSLSRLTKVIELKIHQDLLNTPIEKDLACYFKLPMFLLNAGKKDLAKQTLDFIFEKFYKKNGDFFSHTDLKSVKPEYLQFWTYFNGWILRAALLMKYEIPPIAIQYFKSMRLDNGAFAMNLTESPITDVLTTAHHGLFYLTASKNNWDKSAANFLKQAFDNQPEIDSRFLLRFDEKIKPIMDYNPDEQLFYSIEKNNKEQLYFMMAYPCAFLTQYYKVHKDSSALNTAKQYMEFILSCGDVIYSSRFSHKTAWAASLLYAETNEQKYLDVVQKITAYFISIQDNDGLWFQSEGENVYWDQSAEIGCWFSEIIENLTLTQNKNQELVEINSNLTLC